MIVVERDDRPDDFHARIGTDLGSRLTVESSPKSGFLGASEADAAGAMHQSWASTNGVYWGVSKSHRRLPAGVYRMTISDGTGPCFIRQTNNTDELVMFPDSATEEAVLEVEHFLTLHKRFVQHGLLFKRGMLFWGPPGGGKTSTVQMIVKTLIEKHNVVTVFLEHAGTAATCLRALRRMEPDRLILVVMEDLEVITQHSEHELLSLMDGETQVNGVIFLATTNYPEKLDPRFIDRPSRIDSIRYIGMPTVNDRRAYFQAKLINPTSDEVEQYVKRSDQYSVAYMRELIILTKGFGNTIEYASELLDARRRSSSKLSSASRPDAPHGAGFEHAGATREPTRATVRIVQRPITARPKRIGRAKEKR